MPNTLRANPFAPLLSLINPILLSAAFAIALLVFFTSLALRHIHASQERVNREHLQTSLNSFTELITIWQQQNLGALQMLANSTQGRTLLKQVLLEQGDNPATHDALREWLYPVLVVMGFDGFSVMNQQRIIVAASTKGYIKQPVLLSETREVLDKALARRPAISRPVAAVRSLEGPHGTQPAGSLMQNMCILFESELSAPGYFCLRFNTESSFFPIFLKGRTGSSGEIYAIDNRGRFVTPARFGFADGIDAEANQPVHVGAEVHQPGAPGQFTDMVNFLINHEAGFIKVGYQDYRGVAVSGAGSWLNEMELGIIIEQDIDEAMAPYLASRNIILGLSASAIGLILVLTITAILNRRRLASANQNLEHIVNARTFELMLAKDEAQAATQAKAEFLANMSHEIRTPLNAIIGLAHIALASSPEEKQRNYLEKMRGSGEHLLEVINDILNFSRMEAGKLTLDQSEFSLVQLIDKTVDLVWEKAAVKGLQISIDIDAKIPKLLLGDSLRLGQILINFCANAVKFTDRGRINIRVTQVHDSEKQVELLFEVEDTGIGIDAEKLQSLFQPFQQVDSSSARRFEGTGLGLSICKNLAGLMNGQIDVTSIPEQGSCFRLQVALAKQHQLPDLNVMPRSFSASVLTPVECRILVVEDNALNQEIMESLLESMGASAVCVDSGVGAIAAVQQQLFDVVLMDIQLPCMDGVEATARIRALPQGKHLPIIAVTANALPGDKEKYLAAGLDDYLSKPIDPAQLHRVLQYWAQTGCSVQNDVTSIEPTTALTISPVTNSLVILQQEGIDTVRALHNLMNNEPLYLRLLERFARERAGFPAQLNGLLVNNQNEALNQVHSLKSLAASLGMNSLEAICFNLEQQLHTSEWSKPLVNQLNEELLAMVELVTRCLSIKPA